MPHQPVADAPDDALIRDTILRLTAERGPAKSICPSEAARALSPGLSPDLFPDWQALLPAVRRAAGMLAAAGRLDILRKGKPVDPAQMRGVIRLRGR